MGVVPGSCCGPGGCAGPGWVAIMGKNGAWSEDAWLKGAPICGCEDSEEGQDELGTRRGGPGGDA